MENRLQFSKRILRVPKSFLREIFSVIQDTNIISFAGGLPHPSFFPVEKFKKASDIVLTQHAEEALQYAGSEGYLPLRQYIADQYAKKEGLIVDPSEILITNGSQQALDLLGKVLLDEGDVVALESPTYLAAIQSLSLYGPVFESFKLEADGPNITDLEQLLIQTRPKMLYCIPNFQNPTGITWSNEKRTAVAKLLEGSTTLFVEDDPYGELRWAGSRPKTMTKLTENATLLGSFSKTVAPGLRLGWIYTPNKELYNKLYTAKQASDLHTSTFNQQVLYQYLAQGTGDPHIEKIATAYKAQKDAMVRTLSELLPNISYTNPDGGMFLWLTFPAEVDTQKLFTYALTQKVAFVPGFAFYSDPDTAPTNTARLNFSNTSPEQIREGIERLARAYREYQTTESHQ
jgi:2-aminoadipate transaminase